MIRIDTMGIYQFQITGIQERKAAQEIQNRLDKLYQGGFDICDSLPAIRQEIEATMQVCIVAKFYRQEN